MPDISENARQRWALSRILMSIVGDQCRSCTCVYDVAAFEETCKTCVKAIIDERIRRAVREARDDKSERYPYA